MSSRQIVSGLLGIFLLRLLVIMLWGPDDIPLGGDHGVYHLTAVRLSSGLSEWLRPGTEFGYRAPFYFVYLAAVYSLFPASFKVGQIATSLFGTLNCLLLFLLIRRTMGERPAQIAFWLRGLLPTFIIEDVLVLSEPFFTCFLLSSLLLLISIFRQQTKTMIFLLGVAVGCCLLTREAALVYPVLFGGFLWFSCKGLRPRMQTVALFSVALLMTLSPWLVRNHLVWGQAFPLSYTAGVNLHIGNNPKATGSWMSPPGGVPDGIMFGSPEFNAWHKREAIQWIKEHPMDFCRLGLQKIAAFLSPEFHRFDLQVVFDPPGLVGSGLGLLSGAASAGLLLLGGAGYIFAQRDRYWWFVAWFFCLLFGVIFCSVGVARYRDPMNILLLGYAAWVLVNVRAILRDLRSSPLITVKTVCLVLLWVSLLTSWVYVLFPRFLGS